MISGLLRDTVNATGWTVIEYGTLWQNVGHNMGDDPVADTLIRVETALTQGLPANELPAHPSHVEFPAKYQQMLLECQPLFGRW